MTTTTMKVSEVLRAARGRIDTPDKWCQGNYADGDGRLCALGALMVDTNPPEALRLLYRAADAAGSTVASINDTRTHADVLALYDAAIALAEQEESAAGGAP